MLLDFHFSQSSLLKYTSSGAASDCRHAKEILQRIVPIEITQRGRERQEVF
jgi:hypothetical protein